jgi:hypothetical protein
MKRMVWSSLLLLSLVIAGVATAQNGTTLSGTVNAPTSLSPTVNNPPSTTTPGSTSAVTNPSDPILPPIGSTGITKGALPFSCELFPNCPTSDMVEPIHVDGMMYYIAYWLVDPNGCIQYTQALRFDIWNAMGMGSGDMYAFSRYAPSAKTMTMVCPSDCNPVITDFIVKFGLISRTTGNAVGAIIAAGALWNPCTGDLIDVPPVAGNLICK